MAQTIGIIGGTGPEGKGLAARFAKAGLERDHRLALGRTRRRGGARRSASVAGGTISGATNADAALTADIIIVTLPYSGLADTLPPLADAIGDKIVVSTVVPLEFSGGRVSMLHDRRRLGGGGDAAPPAGRARRRRLPEPRGRTSCSTSTHAHRGRRHRHGRRPRGAARGHGAGRAHRGHPRRQRRPLCAPATTSRASRRCSSTSTATTRREVAASDRRDLGEHRGRPVSITGIEGIPEIQPGDDLGAASSLDAASAQGVQLAGRRRPRRDPEGRLEGRGPLRRPRTTSSRRRWRIELATNWEKDPRHVEVVLRESKRIVRMDHGVIICETRHGFVCANAGVDASNVAGRRLMLLPVDPDASAQHIRDGISKGDRRRRRRHHLGHLRPALAHRLHGGRDRCRRHAADHRLRRPDRYARPRAARDLDLHRRRAGLGGRAGHRQAQPRAGGADPRLRDPPRRRLGARKWCGRQNAICSAEGTRVPAKLRHRSSGWTVSRNRPGRQDSLSEEETRHGVRPEDRAGAGHRQAAPRRRGRLAGNCA